MIAGGSLHILPYFMVLLLACLTACPSNPTPGDERGTSQEGAVPGALAWRATNVRPNLFCIENVCRKQNHAPAEAQSLPPRVFATLGGGIGETDTQHSWIRGSQQPDAGAPMTSSPDAGVLEHDGGPAIDPDGGLLLSNCDPENEAACDDGNPCNGTEVCDERLKVCISGSPIICADQDQCNGIETCNPETGLSLRSRHAACDVPRYKSMRRHLPMPCSHRDMLSVRPYLL